MIEIDRERRELGLVHEDRERDMPLGVLPQQQIDKDAVLATLDSFNNREKLQNTDICRRHREQDQRSAKFQHLGCTGSQSTRTVSGEGRVKTLLPVHCRYVNGLDFPPEKQLPDDSGISSTTGAVGVV
jgi:hypothetical protein